MAPISSGFNKYEYIILSYLNSIRSKIFESIIISALIDRTAEEVARREIPKISANPVGFDGEIFWPGNSFAIDGKGRLILWMPGENRPEQMKDAVMLRKLRM